MVRGKPHAADKILPIVDHPKNSDEISPGEFVELKHTNYVVAHDAPTEAPPAVQVAGAPPQVQATGKK
jgi:hypothetical protein